MSEVMLSVTDVLLAVVWTVRRWYLCWCVTLHTLSDVHCRQLVSKAVTVWPASCFGRYVPSPNDM